MHSKGYEAMKPLTEKQQDDADELELYAVNTGELYPERQRIQAKIKADMQAGTFKPRRSYYIFWLVDAAARYQREIEPRQFSYTVLCAVAVELANVDAQEIKLGAL